MMHPGPVSSAKPLHKTFWRRPGAVARAWLVSAGLLVLAGPAQAAITVEIKAGPNLVVDSNITSPATYAPSAATIGAEVCNKDTSNPVSNVYVKIGDYLGNTPGTYPVLNSDTQLEALDDKGNFLYPQRQTGNYFLTHEGGSAGTADATRYFKDLKAGECRMVYWLVSYPRCVNDSNKNPVEPPCSTASIAGAAKAEDDISLKYDVWASATAVGPTTVTANQSSDFTLRNEISAMANKIQPNGDNKVPQAYIDAINEKLGWSAVGPTGLPVSTNPVYPGQKVITTKGIWYDLGQVGAGFDNDNDGLPDYNAWLQAIGDPSAFDAGCHRMVKSFGLVIVKLNDGTEKLYPLEDQNYITQIPSNNTGAVGLVYYQFIALKSGCSSATSPYQEVASGNDNEKFNSDFGAGFGMTTAPIDTAMGLTKGQAGYSGSNNLLTYTLTTTNTAATPLGAPEFGTPLTFQDSVPAGAVYTAAGTNVGPQGNGDATKADGYYTIPFGSDDGVQHDCPNTATDISQCTVRATACGGFGEPVCYDTCTVRYEIQSTSFVPFYSADKVNWFPTEAGAGGASAVKHIQWQLYTTVKTSGGHDGSACLFPNPTVANYETTEDISLPGGTCLGTDGLDATGPTAADCRKASVQFTATPITGDPANEEAQVCNTGTVSFTLGGDPAASAEVCTTLIGPNTITGTVFKDHGGTSSILANGVQDNTTSEPGISGVTVWLYYDANGNGMQDAGDSLISTYVSDPTTGNFSFLNLPDGKYVVVVDHQDGDLPTGYTNSTPTYVGVSLDPTHASAADAPATVKFGFAPPLTLTKKLTTSGKVYEKDLVTFSIEAKNVLRGDGQPNSTSCTMTVWGSTQADGTGWTSATNATGAPDGVRAQDTTAQANQGGPITIGGFALPTLPSGTTITTDANHRVYVVARGYITGQLENDHVDAKISTSGTWVISSTGFSNAIAPGVEKEGDLLFDVTAQNASWTLASFTGLSANLAYTKGTNTDAEPLNLDAVGLRFSYDPKDGSCTPGAGTILNPVPLTDTFENTKLQFVSASQPPSSTTVAGASTTLTWDNVGPLYPGQTKTINVTFRVPDSVTTTSVSALNTANIANAMYADGRPANSPLSSQATVTIYDNANTGGISGRVYDDNDTSSTYNAGDAGIGGVWVTLYGCKANGAAGDMISGTTTSNSTCSGNNGSWVVVGGQYTAGDGTYAFNGLRSGNYIVAVDEAGFTWTGRTQDPDSLTDGQSDVFSDPLKDLDTFYVTTTNITNANFGYTVTNNAVPLAIGDTLFYDFDGDGLFTTTAETRAIINGLVDMNGNGTIDLGDDGTLGGKAIVDGYINMNGTGAANETTDDGQFLGYKVMDGRMDLDGDGIPGETSGDDSGAVSGQDAGIPNVTIYLTMPDGTKVSTTTLSPIAVINGRIDLNGDGLTNASDTGTLLGKTITDGYVNLNGTATGDDPSNDGTFLSYSVVNGALSVDGNAIAGEASDDVSLAGAYQFTGLNNGTYKVQVDITDPDFPGGQYQASKDPDEAGVCSVCDHTATVKLSTASNQTVDFGYAPLAVTGPSNTISSFVWYDSDNDGIKDGDETGLANITVTLKADLDGDGVYTTVATTTTGSDGSYSFSDLPDGDYRVVVNSTDPDLKTTNSPTNATQYDLTVGEPGTGGLSGRVLWDADANGFSGGDTGMGGMLVGLYDATGTKLLATAYTDANGNYAFLGLPPGNYIVKQQTGTPSADIDGGTANSISVTIADGLTVTGRDFLNNSGSYATLSGRVYDDDGAAPGDDAFGGTDTLVPGVVVRLYSSDGLTLIAETTTNASGLYTFSNIPAGVTYRIVEVDPEGVWSKRDSDSNDAVEGGSGDNTITITPAAGATGNQDFLDDFLDFFNVGGTVRLDADGDGDNYDADAPLSGPTIPLALYTDPNGDGDPSDGVLLQSINTTTGVYLFGDLNNDGDCADAGEICLPNGNYVVVETDPTSPAVYFSTNDDDGINRNTWNQLAVNLSGADSSGNDFRDAINTNVGLGDLTGVVSEDSNDNLAFDAGDTDLSGVTLTLYADPNGDGIPDSPALRTTATNGSGVYTFDNLPPGTYVVIETDPATYVSVADCRDADANGSCAVATERYDRTADGNNRIVVVVTSGGNSQGNNFLDNAPADLYSITGKAFYDLNHNNGFNASPTDTLMAGVRIALYIDADSNDTPDSTIPYAVTSTDSTGSYSFAGLPEGRYLVVEYDPAVTGVVSDAAQGSGLGSTTATVVSPNMVRVVLNGGNGTADFLDDGLSLYTLSGSIYTDANPAGSPDGSFTSEAKNTAVAALISLYTDPNGDGDPSDGQLITTTYTTSNGLLTGGIITGDYSFGNLPAGRYVVVETDPAGYISTNDTDGVAYNSVNQIGVNLTATSSGHNFLDATGSLQLSGTVRRDDGDGVIEDGDASLAGVTIYLYLDTNGDGRPDGDPIASTLTQASGGYTFSNLPNGKYVVVESDPPGYYSAADFDTDRYGNNAQATTAPYPVSGNSANQIAVTLSGTSINKLDFLDDQTPDFGFNLLASIGDTVFWDINANGTQDGNEPGIAGVKIGLYSYTDIDRDGKYDPDDYYDANNNGLWDTGEPKETLGALLDSATTDSNGNYLFSDLVPGNYAVKVLASNFANTGSCGAGSGALCGGTLTADPEADGLLFYDPLLTKYFKNNNADYCGTPTIPSYPINPDNTDWGQEDVCDAVSGRFVSGSGSSGLDFGYKLPSNVVGDRVWLDLNNDDKDWLDYNGDNKPDAYESGIPGVRVYIDTDSGNDIDWTDGNGNGVWDSGEGERWVSTDSEGYYSFVGLPAGDHPVKVFTADLPTGLTASHDKDGGGTYGGDGATSVTITGTDNNLTDVDFGYFYTPQYTISGTVCLDGTTPDGKCDTGETGYGAVPVYLYRLNDTSGSDNVRTTIINGRVDVNGDGKVDDSDDKVGAFAGYNVVNGYVDVNASNTITSDGADDASPVLTTWKIDDGLVKTISTSALVNSVETWTLVAQTTTSSSGDYTLSAPNLTTSPDQDYVVLVGAPASLLVATTSSTANGGTVQSVVGQTDGQGFNVSIYQVIDAAGNTINVDFAYQVGVKYDFGDLPLKTTFTDTASWNYKRMDQVKADGFPTTRADSGARHYYTGTCDSNGAATVTVWLGEGDGEKPRCEGDGVPGATAANDTNEGGLILPNIAAWGEGQTVPIQLKLTASAPKTAYVVGFIDWNQDGDFGDAGEYAIQAEKVVFSGAGTQTATFQVKIPAVDANGAGFTGITGTSGPNDVQLNQGVFMRFRVFATDPTFPQLLIFGETQDGEVEDHMVNFPLDFGDAPTIFNTKFGTLGKGARHFVVAGGPYTGDAAPYAAGATDGGPVADCTTWTAGCDTLNNNTNTSQTATDADVKDSNYQFMVRQTVVGATAADHRYDAFLKVTVTNPSSNKWAQLVAWADFNDNGSFANQAVSLTGGERSHPDVFGVVGGKWGVYNTTTSTWESKVVGTDVTFNYATDDTLATDGTFESSGNIPPMTDKAVVWLAWRDISGANVTAVSGAKIYTRVRVTTDTTNRGVNGENHSFFSNSSPTADSLVGDGNVQDGQGTWTPTFVILTDVGASLNAKGKVVFNWRTVVETGTVGFYVERADAGDGRFHRVNHEPLPALLAAEGGAYSLVDPGARPGIPYDYRIVEIDTTGAEITYGPWTLSATETGPDVEEGYARAVYEPSDEDKAKLKASREEQRTRKTGRPARNDGVRLVIKTTQAGLHLVPKGVIGDTLDARGNSLEQWLKTGQLSLTNRGKEVAWTSTTAGLVFYAETIGENPYTGTNVYILEKKKGVRMVDQSATVKSPASFGTTFLDRVDFEKATVPVVSLHLDPMGDFLFWGYAYSSGNTVLNGSLPFQIQGLIPTGNACLTLRLQASTAVGNRVSVALNGTPIQSLVEVQGAAAAAPEICFSAALLREGANTLVVSPIKGVTQIVYADGFELRYPRRLSAVDGRLLLNGRPGGVAAVSGLRGTEALVLDVTDPIRPIRLDVGMAKAVSGDGYGIAFATGSETRLYAIADAAGLIPPAAIEAGQFEVLKATENGADYLVITPGFLEPEAQQLAAYRATQGFTTKVVVLDDIYREFGDGVVDALAIKRFLAHTLEKWTSPPRYVVLAGKGSYDHKDSLGKGGSLIPVIMVKYPWGLTSCDACFADVDDDGLADVAIGRLPVLTSTDLRGFIEKVKRYEAEGEGTWNKSVMLVADNADLGGNFPDDSRQLGWLIPSPPYGVEELYLGQQGLVNATQLRSRILNGVAEGRGLVNYIGHGGPTALAGESILTPAHVAGLRNNVRLPVFAAWTCAASRFELPGVISVGEQWVANPLGGGIGSIGATGLTLNQESLVFADAAFETLFSTEDRTLGDVLQSAQRHYSGGMPLRFMQDVYLLIGDPATRLH